MFTIKYNIDDLDARKMVNGIADRITKPQAALKECGLVLLRSIAKNFKVGGRPTKWKPSKRALATVRGKTLIDTGRLRKSITMEVSGSRLVVGTNVKYAAIHQFGGSGSQQVGQHWRTISKAFGRSIPPRSTLVQSHHRKMKIDARPFVMIQDSDYTVLGKILNSYIAKGPE